jgi:hypothetical protein
MAVKISMRVILLAVILGVLLSAPAALGGG